MSEWKGVVPAVVTPLKDKGGEIDIEAMRSYCDFLVERGIQGLFVVGTTGEGPLLSSDERKLIAETVVDQVKGKVRVIIQSGCITTEETIKLTQHTRDIGADAAGIVLPYYYGLDEEALFRHFARVAEAVPEFPFFIYNIPQCTGNNLSPGLFQKLIKNIDSLVGIKTSNPDIFQLQEYVRLAKDKCSIFVGCDGLILLGLTVGAKGIVSGNASAFPEPFVEIYQAFAKGDLPKARQCQALIDKLRAVAGAGCYIDAFKKALEFRGVRAGCVRAPHRELSAEEVAKLRESLKELKLIS